LAIDRPPLTGRHGVLHQPHADDGGASQRFRPTSSSLLGSLDRRKQGVEGACLEGIAVNDVGSDALMREGTRCRQPPRGQSV
jgi:hypothetical protein